MMHREIPIYSAEAEAGISEVITAKENRSIAAYCPLLMDKQVNASIKEHTKVKNVKRLESASAAEDQFDLHYIYTILATTGWNRNDDVFDSKEMWLARNSAEDKPFNKGHDPNNIIGHITGNAVVDENYELVKNDSKIDLLPDKFHVLTSAVVYKHLASRDEKLTLATKQLLQEIVEGKWFVSMEALFSDFDYALMSVKGEQNIVLRNEETAFLSKHLRSYGGQGEYDGYRVGRLMRNMTFSGKGLVENPGNPESIIFKKEDNELFKGVAESTPNLLVTSSSKGESSMSDNNEQVRVLESQVEKLEARLKELDEEKVQAQISEFEAACADKDAEITELKSQLNAANEAVQASNKSAEEFETAKAESDKTIAELNEKLNAIEAENIKTSRVSALVDKGINKSEAESLVETFAGITDEQFDALVTKLAESAFPFDKEKDEKKKKKNGDEDKEDDTKAGGMKKKYSEKAEEGQAEAEEAAEAADEAQDAEALDSAEAENAPALAAQSESESEGVVASLNSYFSNVLGSTNNKDES